MQQQIDSLCLNQTEWPEFKIKNISTVQALRDLTQFLNLKHFRLTHYSVGPAPVGQAWKGTSYISELNRRDWKAKKHFNHNSLCTGIYSNSEPPEYKSKARAT